MGEKLLLDTQALILWMFDPDDLSTSARSAVEDPDNEVFVSAVSAMEISTKVGTGKLGFARKLATDFLPQIEEEGFQELVLNCTHARVAGNLPQHHKDPWDRLLIAQAQVEQLRLVSGDRAFDRYGVSRLW